MIDLARELALRAVTERNDSDRVSATITICDEQSGLDTNYIIVKGFGQYAPEAFDNVAQKLRILDGETLTDETEAQNG